MPSVLANPGNIVVPLSTIIDQLQGKLSTADITSLLYAVVAKQKREVRPGDLISADLMNQLLNDVADLQLRVSQLEGASVGTSVKIDRILPAVARMGDELRVFGSGLAAAKLQSISIEGTTIPIWALKQGSSDQLMIFDIPAIIGIPDAGRNAVLTVQSTSSSSDFGTFYLLPGIPTTLQANFNIKRTTVNPAGATVANTSYDYTFSIEAFTSVDESYTIQPQLTNAPADWTAAVKGSADLFIAKSTPTSTTTSVVVTLKTGASGTGQLALGLRSKNFATVTGSSMAETVTIGVAPPPPNLDVDFLTPTVLGSVQKFSAGSLYIQIDQNVANQVAKINPLQVRLKQPGRYNIGNPVVSDQRWTVTITNASRVIDTTGTPNAIMPLRFDVNATAGAPDATASIAITGDGTLPSGTFTFALKLRANPSNPVPP